MKKFIKKLFKNWTYQNNKEKNRKRQAWFNISITKWIGENWEKHITLQICSTPSFHWKYSADGGEGEIHISYWLIVNWYWSFSSIFPETWIPREYNQFADIIARAGVKSGEYNNEIGKKNRKLKRKYRTKENGWIRTASKEVSLSFHHYTMWWQLWTDSNSWDSKTPKWRHGNMSFTNWFVGKWDMTKKVSDWEEFVLPYYEGSYRVIAVEELWRKKSKNRFYMNLFYRTFFKYEVIAGFFDDCGKDYKPDNYQHILYEGKDYNPNYDKLKYGQIKLAGLGKKNPVVIDGAVTIEDGTKIPLERIKKHLKTIPVPHQGKGTASYNCGEDATYSISFGSRSNINSCRDAAMEFLASTQKDREKYGGKNWIPQKFEGKKVEIVGA